jgi:hypothetical protein
VADVAMWTEKNAKAEFEARGKVRLEELKTQLEGQKGVVAIEPDSGDYFVGATLGKANAAAFVRYPDTWVYFARLDDATAAIALPTW